MTKKKPAIKKVAPVEAEPIEPEPAEELPVRQLEEVHETEPIEQPAEPEPVAETASIVETVAHESEPEKSAEVVLPPIVEPTPAPIPVPTSKPKPLTMTSLHTEIEELRKIVDGQAIFIKQLLEAPVKQRKPPLSNGKIQILDTLTGKSYPSKNATYQSLLKAGELSELVNKGLLGNNPYKNNFGCYILFRAFPGRFQESKPEETKVQLISLVGTEGIGGNKAAGTLTRNYF